MSDTRIQTMINAIVQHFDRHTTLADAKAMMHDAKTAVAAFYRRELGAENTSLAEAAAADPQAIHRLTEENFGFKVHEQPQYQDVDDYAWEFSQRYTTLENVTLPDNAVFYTSKRQEIPREEAIRQMEAGGHHLFDIALSNEYVLLDENEKFTVNDIENRFSTNNEHLPPQSGSRRDGTTKIFRSDPRAIIIAYSETNGARGHLQVVFHDENGKPIESVAMHRRPGETESEITRQSFDAAGERQNRYPIGPEDAPYYAYALALTHFANGFNEDMKKNWFDREQAQEVVNMLKILAAKDVEENKEPVIRDILGDAKVLKGNINPTALLPEVYAAALQAEIDKGEFRGLQAAEAPAQSSFAQRVRERAAEKKGIALA